MALVLSNGMNPKPLVIEKGHEFDAKTDEKNTATQASIKGMKLSNRRVDLNEEVAPDYQYQEYQPRRMVYGSKDIEV